MKSILENEIRYFEAIEQELLEKYLNKFVVVKDHSVKGVYGTIAEAYSESSELFEEGTFLIRQCLKYRRPRSIHSRFFLKSA